MPRKPDYSRMVMLTLTPSQSVVLKALLMTVGQRAVDPPLEITHLIADAVDSIDLQLKAIAWPEDRLKPPYPV